MATVREMMVRLRSPNATSRKERNRQRRGGALREMWYIVQQAQLAYSDDEHLNDEHLEGIEEEEGEVEELEDEEEKQAVSLPTPTSTGRPPLFPHLPLRMPLPSLHKLSPRDVAHMENVEERKDKEKREKTEEEEGAVSYTHLTLPTICSV